MIQMLQTSWQEGTIKLGKTTNLMDKGGTETGDFKSRSTGDERGMSPSSVSRNGAPFSSAVRLRRYPFWGVKWYSSRDTDTPTDRLPTHENICLRRCTNDLFSGFGLARGALTSTRNSVRLLKLIKSKVTPALCFVQCA